MYANLNIRPPTKNGPKYGLIYNHKNEKIVLCFINHKFSKDFKYVRTGSTYFVLKRTKHIFVSTTALVNLANKDTVMLLF